MARLKPQDQQPPPADGAILAAAGYVEYPGGPLCGNCEYGGGPICAKWKFGIDNENGCCDDWAARDKRGTDYREQEEESGEPPAAERAEPEPTGGTAS